MNYSKVDDLVELLKKNLKKDLPGQKAQEKMLPIIKESNLQYFNEHQKLKKAAVLILLFNDNSKIKTVFIERTPDPGPHSGQIAFPGGRKEKHDNDLIDTAIREAYEEIGVKVNKSDIIGCLTPIEIPVSGFSVLPVIASIKTKPEFIRCYEEVNNIFVVELLNLLKNKAFKTVPARGIHIDTPCYMFNDSIIWGATAMVLSELEEVIHQKE